MSRAPGGLVCGFGDAAAGVGGLAWDLGEPGAVLLSDGEARPGTFALEEGGGDVAVVITAGEASLEATLSARTAELALAGGPVATVCAADARPAGGTQTFECPGQICRWTGTPLEGAGAFRQIAVEAGEEAILIVAARGERGIQAHGEEETRGWLIQGEDASPFEESLISTQYDGSGGPTRIALELWPADADQTSRAAATRVSGSLLGGARSGSSWASFFRCHSGGAEGLGTYLLWRA
jgi:hypothetical protein